MILDLQFSNKYGRLMSSEVLDAGYLVFIASNYNQLLFIFLMKHLYLNDTNDKH